ncbi:hypothetical protein DAEQUDRAFT_111889 [Daedalea quercina L-15889]|uniref:Uncharacterized protein n=1 Tax=Daedalea quercina L-15889 TaxID=1314783 RepID=A0A165S5H5_9APHY|nr:hypothetical protein DAEQUDRAFT_111889 [Daedalea quercina L-15889]
MKASTALHPINSKQSTERNGCQNVSRVSTKVKLALRWASSPRPGDRDRDGIQAALVSCSDRLTANARPH